MGSHGDRTGERHWHAVGGMFMSAAGMLMLALLDNSARQFNDRGQSHRGVSHQEHPIATVIGMLQGALGPHLCERAVQTACPPCRGGRRVVRPCHTRHDVGDVAQHLPPAQ